MILSAGYQKILTQHSIFRRYILFWRHRLQNGNWQAVLVPALAEFYSNEENPEVFGNQLSNTLLDLLDPLTTKDQILSRKCRIRNEMRTIPKKCFEVTSNTYFDFLIYMSLFVDVDSSRSNKRPLERCVRSEIMLKLKTQII